MTIWQLIHNNSMEERSNVLLRNCFLFPKMGQKARDHHGDTATAGAKECLPQIT